LFPWNWEQTGAGTYKPPIGYDSASDGDINIALAYIYADTAV
jgi:endo-1,4-beta-D-glucanase Y